MCVHVKISVRVCVRVKGRIGVLCESASINSAIFIITMRNGDSQTQ